MESEVKTLKEFQKWAKIQLLMQDKTQRALAEELSIAYPRISEALHGKRTGRRYIRQIIEKLGGNLEDFREFLQEYDTKN
ncbi:MAG: XRE family transcriptional regulator [Lachnospiraceae bacterium]|nr:XRE family transcriptional regulator [Lachnospiraceae bacterium]